MKKNTMTTIDLNRAIVNLDGSDLASMGQTLAHVLMNEKTGDPVKLFDWALSLHRGEPIMVDASDFSKIKEIVKNTDGVIMLAKAQLIKALDAIK